MSRTKEDVIKDIEYCIAYDVMCEKCSHYQEEEEKGYFTCMESLLGDALDFLKRQDEIIGNWIDIQRQTGWK